MKFSTVAVTLAAASVVAAQHSNGDTTWKKGKFDKTKHASTTSNTDSTHKWGKFDKTKHASTTSNTDSTHKWGKFDKTNRNREASANNAALAKMSSSFFVAGIAAYLL